MKPKLTTRILKYLLIASAMIAAVYALIWIALQGYSTPWTGFGDFTKPSGDFVRGKTLWDWMQLFIIPIFLSFGVFLLNHSERESERQRSEERTKLEREIATDRQQESALQAYLDRMADLLLKNSLRKPESEEARDVARIRTLTVLRGLDAKRKGMVILFLQEAGLISKENLIVNLTGASLQNAFLQDADLTSVFLQGVDLTDAELAIAKLQGANLQNAFLLRTSLSTAKLQNADLTNAFLQNSFLTGANLTSANLTNAGLTAANVSYANLTDADLTNADLTNVDLTNADLRGAKVSREQLARVKSLRGAIMPDGTIHD